jgi:hypothetical protein
MRWLLLGLGLAACAEKEGEPQLLFHVQHWDLISGSTLPHSPERRRVEVSPIPTGIRVTGAVVLPDPCDKVEAVLEPEPRALRLRVRVIGDPSHGEKCGVGSRAEVGYYQADISGLAPGTYRLLIFHDFEGRSAAAAAQGPSREVVLDDSVQVLEQATERTRRAE